MERIKQILWRQKLSEQQFPSINYPDAVNGQSWSVDNAAYCYKNYGYRLSNKKTRNRIAFIIPNTNVFQRFLPIFQYLKKNQFDCILCSPSQETINILVHQLEEKQLPYQFMQEAILSKIKYKLVISNFVPGGETPYPKFAADGGLLKILGETQIGLIYSDRVTEQPLSESNQFYDFIFSYGPFYTKKIKEKLSDCNTIEIDYLLHNDFNKPNETQELRYNLGLNGNKQTICYMPTHGAPSTFDSFIQCLEELSDYNIVIKPHYMVDLTNYSEIYPHVILCDGHHDNAPFYQIADYIITDDSNVVLDAVYIKKKLLLLGANFPKYDESNFTANSPGFILKDRLGSMNTISGDKLKKQLKNEQFWIEQNNTMEKIKKEYFSFSSLPGQNAANALIKLLNNKLV